MPRMRGLTLAELLVTLVVLSIIAAVTVPTLSHDGSRRLDAAVERTGNALRHARSEAMRTGALVLVDAETAPGRLRLLRTGCGSAATAAAVLDPLSRQPYDEDIMGSTNASGVTVTARFMVAGSAYGGLVFDASGAATRACSVGAGIDRGVPEAGSSIELAYNGLTHSISIDPPTGRITGLLP
jgi:prepilin-type N-terminal cleavage/methylation domain-containing protein